MSQSGPLSVSHEHYVPHDPHTDTQRLRAVAPSLAAWPRFMRNLPAAAVWTGVVVLFAAAAGLFWRTVTLSTEVALLHKDAQTFEAAIQDVQSMRRDFAVVKWNTQQLMYSHDSAVWVLQADWNRRHHLPVPPPPIAPPAGPDK